MADWSNLPEELLCMIADRLFSAVEILHFRSICRSWRSIVFADATPIFPSLPFIQLKTLLSFSIQQEVLFVPTSFSRVTRSSSNQGWLIKHDAIVDTQFICLQNPFSRLPLRHGFMTINLLEYNVSEVHSAYIVHDQRFKNADNGFKRVALVSVKGRDPWIVGIGLDGVIRYWNGEIWTRLCDQVAEFSDIIVYKGKTYALDSKGIIWWINSSLENHRNGPGIDEDITKFSSEDLRIIECSGELYIIDRLLEKKPHRRNVYLHDNFGNTVRNVTDMCYGNKTVGFKVYKMDQEVVKWVEVKSLGGYAIVMAIDTCFSILAEEFYGCLKNSIYFTHKGEEEIKVFKLDDCSISTKNGKTRSCFQMFDLFFV